MKKKLDLSPAKPSTLVTFLLDRSGSMQNIKSATIEGFNAYLDTLKAEKNANIFFTFTQFDSPSGFLNGLEFTTICRAIPVAKASKLNAENFIPRGMTPLIDAAFETILATESALAKRDDSTKVVICIQTDGDENTSRNHSWESLRALISAKQEAGWEFNFMGAGIDAYKQASRMGLNVGQTMSYDASDLGSTRAAFIGSAVNTVNYASAVTDSVVYSDLQKRAAGDKFDPKLNK